MESASNLSIEDLFAGLVDQTRRRGGSPSALQIINAAASVRALEMAYDELRKQLLANVQPAAVLRAIKRADEAIARLSGLQVAEAKSQSRS